MRVHRSAVLAFAVLILMAMGPPVFADRLDDEARAIEAKLIAPCCWSQQVSLHQSEAATKIKDEIRASLREGRTRDEILNAYVAQYGTQILAEPPARGFGAWLYVMPVVALVLSGVGVTLVVRRFAKRGAETAASPQATAPEDARLAEQLDDELGDMD